jgi:hypothetical protein
VEELSAVALSWQQLLRLMLCRMQPCGIDYETRGWCIGSRDLSEISVPRWLSLTEGHVHHFDDDIGF